VAVHLPAPAGAKVFCFFFSKKKRFSFLVVQGNPSFNPFSVCSCKGQKPVGLDVCSQLGFVEERYVLCQGE
jgi:hypothetical protein